MPLAHTVHFKLIKWIFWAPILNKQGVIQKYHIKFFDSIGPFVFFWNYSSTIKHHPYIVGVIVHNYSFIVYSWRKYHCNMTTISDHLAHPLWFIFPTIGTNLVYVVVEWMKQGLSNICINFQDLDFQILLLFAWF